MAVHFFNDFTLKKSTVVGLQASVITICMFLCQWFILSSTDFKCQLLQTSSSKETLQLIRSNTLTTYRNTNMAILRNAVDYIELDTDKAILNLDAECTGTLY